MSIQVENNDTYSLYNERIDSNHNVKEAAEDTAKAQDQTENNSAIDIDYEDYQDVVYGREGIADIGEKERTILGDFINNGVDNCCKMECYDPSKEKSLTHEIYCISIYDGKVHVTGGAGYQDKAAAYEKLLNASFGYAYKWSFGGRMINEEQALNKLDDILQYYMKYDQQIYQQDKNDSIANHVGDAFDEWYQSNKPERTRFVGMA